MGIWGEMKHAVGHALWTGTKAVGNAGLTLADYGTIGAVKAGIAGTKVAVNAATRVGGFAGGFIKESAKHVGHSLTQEKGNPIGVAAETGSKIINKVADHTAEWKYPEYRMGRDGKLKLDEGGFKFTPIGFGMLLGSGAAISALNGTRDYMDRRQGQLDGSVRSATPEIKAEEYSNTSTPLPSSTGSHLIQPVDNGGATGDLVFALNANRH